jgi:hypothetical protein
LAVVRVSGSVVVVMGSESVEYAVVVLWCCCGVAVVLLLCYCGVVVKD